MTPILNLQRPWTDDERISPDMLREFDISFEMRAIKNEYDWDEDSHVYSVIFNYGLTHTTGTKSIVFEVCLDDLEMFAHSLVKSIEMLRRDYKEVIQEKIKNGNLL